MDRQEFGGADGTTFVDGLANNINNAAEGLLTDGHHNGSTNVHNGLSADKTFSRVQSDGADVVATQMLSDLEHESVLGALDLKRIENGGKCALELNVDDGTNNLRNFSGSRGKAACLKTT